MQGDPNDDDGRQDAEEDNAANRAHTESLLDVIAGAKNAARVALLFGAQYAVLLRELAQFTHRGA